MRPSCVRNTQEGRDTSNALVSEFSISLYLCTATGIHPNKSRPWDHTSLDNTIITAIAVIIDVYTASHISLFGGGCMTSMGECSASYDIMGMGQRGGIMTGGGV